MKELKENDVRRKGDEVRAFGHYPKWVPSDRDGFELRVEPWQPVSLIGQRILKSDLMVSQFRRP